MKIWSIIIFLLTPLLLVGCSDDATEYVIEKAFEYRADEARESFKDEIKMPVSLKIDLYKYAIRLEESNPEFSSSELRELNNILSRSKYRKYADTYYVRGLRDIYSASIRMMNAVEKSEKYPDSIKAQEAVPESLMALMKVSLSQEIALIIDDRKEIEKELERKEFNQRIKNY